MVKSSARKLHVVTGTAIVLYGECRLAVVAGTTGLASTHLFHVVAFAFLMIRNENTGVTIAATVHGRMGGVRKGCITIIYFEGDVMGWVAGTAVIINGKGFGAVMAGAAGFAFTHIVHGECRIFTAYDIKNLVVAEGTFFSQSFKVIEVAEVDRASCFDVHFDNIFDPASSRRAGEYQDKCKGQK